ncbi:MAG: DUF6111 family protein [Geminicoccaceae bacterium]|nr:DUF6111 family protein [Geminicoccaceae bacterium]
MRFFITYLLPLILPLAIYLLVVWATRGQQAGWLDETPWLVLIGAGVALLALSLIGWSLLSGDPISERYVPPHLEGGEVVPGQTVAPDDG